MNNSSENISKELRSFARSIMAQKVLMPSIIATVIIIFSLVFSHASHQVILISVIIAFSVVILALIFVAFGAGILWDKYVLEKYIKHQNELAQSYENLADHEICMKEAIMALDPLDLEPWPKVVKDLSLIKDCFEKLGDTINQTEQENLQRVTNIFNNRYFQFVKHNQGEAFIKDTEMRESKVKEIAQNFRAWREKSLQEFIETEKGLPEEAKKHQIALAQIHSKASEKFSAEAKIAKAKALTAMKQLEFL